MRPGADDMVALAIKRNRGDAAKRFIIETGDPGIRLEILDHVENLDRGPREDREADIGIGTAKARGQFGGDGQRSREDGEPQITREPVADCAHLVPHCARIPDDPPRPVEHALPLRRQPAKTRAPPDQQHAELPFELFYPGRKARLRDPETLGRPAKMLLTRQGDEHLQLVDQDLPSLTGREETENCREWQAVGRNLTWLAILEAHSGKVRHLKLRRQIMALRTFFRDHRGIALSIPYRLRAAGDDDHKSLQVTQIIYCNYL